MFQVPSNIKTIQTLVDGGNKITLLTQELAPDEMTELFKLTNKAGWFLFKETEIKEEDVKDIPEVAVEFKGEKSPSQKMYNIIYRIWENNTDMKKPFPDYYKSYMFKLNEALKEKI